MSNNNVQFLEFQIAEATKARDALMARIADSTDTSELESFSAMQRNLASLRSQLDAAKSAASSASAPASGGATGIVHLICGGKDNRRVEVSVGTTLGQIVTELGLDTSNHEVKRRIGPGQTVDLANWSNFPIQSGDTEVILVPKVKGGC